jgi:hypothetical protein
MMVEKIRKYSNIKRNNNHLVSQWTFQDGAPNFSIGLKMKIFFKKIFFAVLELETFGCMLKSTYRTYLYLESRLDAKIRLRQFGEKRDSFLE